VNGYCKGSEIGEVIEAEPEADQERCGPEEGFVHQEEAFVRQGESVAPHGR
jgi:hypothetical protein